MGSKAIQGVRIEKRGPAHGPSYPFDTPGDGQRIVALMKDWTFKAGSFHLSLGDRTNFLDGVGLFQEYASNGRRSDPVEFGDVRGWKPVEGERRSKVRPGPAKRWGMSANPEEYGWEGSGETLEDARWEARDRQWQKEDDAKYATADARWEYQIGVFNANWKDALDRTGRLRVVEDFLKSDAWWRSDPHFYWPQGPAQAPDGKTSTFELFLNTSRDTILREIRLHNELQRELGVQQPQPKAEPPLVFEEVWHRKNEWREQLQRVNDKLFELKFLRDRVWTGKRAELGFFIRDARTNGLIVLPHINKKLFEAGLSIEETNDKGKLVINQLLEEEIRSAHDTARDDSSIYNRKRSPKTIELQVFLQSLASK